MDAEIMKFCRAFIHNVDGCAPIRDSQFMVLNIMCTKPGPHVPVSIAKELQVSKAMISNHVAALMARGLIVRMPSPEDGRSVYLMPSKRGRDLFNKISGKNTEKMNLIKSHLGARNYETFIKLITQINQIIDG